MKTMFIAFVAIVGLSNVALANAPVPGPPTPIPTATVTGNSVEIHIENAYLDKWEEGPLVRMDAAGNTVQFDFASREFNPAKESARYLDECVPPGIYKYGLSRNPGCSYYEPDVTFYVVVEVTQSLGACKRTGIGDPPKPIDEAPLWQHFDATVHCEFDEGGCSVAGSHGSELVVAGQILAILLGLMLFSRQRRRS